MDDSEATAKLAYCTWLAAEIEKHKQAMHDLAAERQEVIRQLRGSGFSLGRLAIMTGLSKARIQQLGRPA